MFGKQKMKWLMFICALLMLQCTLLITADAANINGILIQLNDLSQVNGPHIELGEISVIDAPDDVRESLGNLRIGIAPPLSTTISYRKSDLKARLALEGYAETDYTVTGADTVKIERAGVNVGSADLENALQDELTATFSGIVELKWLTKLPDIRVNAGDLEIAVKYPSHRLGALPQLIVVTVDGRLARQFPLSGYVSFSVPAVISKIGIPRGAVVSPDMVEIERRTLSPGSAVITSFEGCLGLEAKRNIGAGEQLSYESLMKPFDVKRGDALAVTVFKGNITIEAVAIASENGYIGEQILAKLDDTGKSLRITLTSHNTGVVALPS